MITLAFGHSIAAQTYHNLVLKGGGIRGIAYCGALKVLDEKNVSSDIRRVGGTSVGAIVGALYSAGFTAAEIEAIMFELDIKTFNDGQWFFWGGQKRMRKKFGWYKGDRLQQWLGRLIKEKTGSAQTTFMQLHELAKKDNRYKDLYVTATNLTLQRLEIFSWQTFPNMPIVKAVRASASIPLYYEAVLMDSLGNTFKKTDSNCCVYADGGLLANYPITLFNEANDSGKINQFTLGLKLDRPEQISYYHTNNGLAPFKINSFKNYVAGLYNITIEQLNPSVPYAIEKLHTIYISTGNIGPKVRQITSKQKKELYNNGVIAAEQFFGR